jgi:putative hydrolase of the HAD superfamily
MICKKLSIQPQEMVHIGDHKEFDYLSPQKLGIVAYHLDRDRTTIGPGIVHDLKEFENIIRKQTPASHTLRKIVK